MKTLLMFVFATISLFALEGNYTVQGYDPYEKKAYSGTAVITKDKNNVYQGTWILDGEKFAGTGYREKSKISFVFQSAKETGVTIYEIDGSLLKGSFVLLNGSLVGNEEMQKQ